MKKLFLTAIVAGVAITFTSCKKNYTCTCTENKNGVLTTVGMEVMHGTKSEVQTRCSALFVLYGGTAVDCKI